MMLGLRKMRNRKGLTMREVASELNCTVNTVWRQEKGLQQPKLDALRRMAQLYECTVDELIGPSSPATGQASSSPETEGHGKSRPAPTRNGESQAKRA